MENESKISLPCMRDKCIGKSWDEVAKFVEEEN